MLNAERSSPSMSPVALTGRGRRPPTIDSLPARASMTLGGVGPPLYASLSAVRADMVESPQRL
ncbi:hypothetical protein VD0002_g2633 [Verticillium dahliae]|nr:hypothetical protein VD0003_g1833 [Verticillium dahliae]PNH66845.1 hypothetical protein VD0002_g2633 [Verticillium dahliae]